MRGKGRQGDVKSWLEVTVYLRAGKRTDCSCGQAVEAEGFELLRGRPFDSKGHPIWGVFNHESQPSTHLKHRPAHHTKPSPDYRGALFQYPVL